MLQTYYFIQVGEWQQGLEVRGDCSKGRGRQGRARGARRLSGNVVPVREMGVDKRIVWGLFATFQRSYILIQDGLCTVFRAGTPLHDG